MDSITKNSKPIGIDTGFGHTKYAFIDVDGELVLGKFPSVVAFAKDNTQEISNGVHILENVMYYVGDMALKQPAHAIREIVTYKDLEKYAPLLIAHALEMENLQPKDVESITCGLSPAHRENSGDFKERVSNFTINDVPYGFDVKLLPQGVGAVQAIKHFAGTGDVEEANDYLVVDIGFNTMDVIFVYDKKIQRGKINEDNSFEKKGAINIAEMMQKHIKMNFDRDITLKESLAIVTQGNYRLRGAAHELEEVINGFKKEYTEGIMRFLEANYSNELDKMEKVCFVGGGGYFIDKKYAAHIETFQHSEYYNAIGNLIFKI